jgi:hypothetical protein
MLYFGPEGSGGKLNGGQIVLVRAAVSSTRIDYCSVGDVEISRIVRERSDFKMAKIALSADAVLSAGYLFFAYSDYLVKFSTFDTCSSVGAAFCLIGIVAAFMGKGMAVRVLILFGCFAGMLFWYLTIGPHT